MSFEELANLFHDFLIGHNENQTTESVVESFMDIEIRSINEAAKFVMEVKEVAAPSTVTELRSVVDTPDYEVECVIDDASYSDMNIYFNSDYMEACAWLRNNELLVNWINGSLQSTVSRYLGKVRERIFGNFNDEFLEVDESLRQLLERADNISRNRATSLMESAIPLSRMFTLN